MSNNSIDTAIDRLKNGGFKKGISSVIFLLYKNLLFYYPKYLDRQ